MGGAVYAARAADADSGSNGRVSYSVSQGAGHFRIDGRTGDLVLTSPLDRESKNEHLVIIQVQQYYLKVLPVFLSCFGFFSYNFGAGSGSQSVFLCFTFSS